MSNLNKFKDSYQVLEKKSKTLSHEKNKNSKTHKECLNNFFWPKILPQTSYVLMCIKWMNMTRTKCPIVIFLIQKVNSKNFGPLIEHGPHWINFTILTFIVKTIDILETYVKFRTKLLHLK
jgi:hypothetical protein